MRSRGVPATPTARHVLADLCDTIEATGGVRREASGHVAPVADPDWIDLGEAYLAACEVLGRKPKIVRRI